MKVKYFKDTDTIFIEFRPVESSETKELDENTILEIDSTGKICGITIEHASLVSAQMSLSSPSKKYLHSIPPQQPNGARASRLTIGSSCAVRS
jgi:uncharacterized protein YuzE